MTTTRRKSRKPAADVYQVVTDRMIEALEKGNVPWHQPWNSNHNRPRNIQGHVYRGVNVFLLGMSGYTSPFWMTYKQAQERGGTVKKGEHGTWVTFWKRLRVEDKDNPGQTKVIPLLRHYVVFNVEQTEGVKLPKTVAEWSPMPTDNKGALDEGEAIVKGYENGPRIHENGTEAYYIHALDSITVPPRGAFDHIEDFYATLFHEMGHSTGAARRLNRPELVKSDGFGGHQYGREELVAEMTAAFLLAEAGIETTRDNNAAYLASWLRVLREDNQAVVVAAGKAQRASDHILGVTWADEETTTNHEQKEEAAA